MEQIVIQVKSKSKAQALVTFLKTLEFVETVSQADLPTTEMPVKDAEFLALAGLWAGRDLTQETLRRLAWPERA